MGVPKGVGARSATPEEDFKIEQLPAGVWPSAPPRPLLYTSLAPAAEFRQTSVYANMWTHHHQRATIFRMYWPSYTDPTQAASFLFALIKLSFLGSSAANHFVRTLARLRPLTQCSLITNVRRVRFIFDGVKAAALLTLALCHYYVTINTYIETHFPIRSDSSFDTIRKHRVIFQKCNIQCTLTVSIN